MKKIISKHLIKRGFRKLVKEIRNRNEHELDSTQTIDFLFSKKAELIRPWQFRDEILSLAKEIESLKPSVVVEIGTANGGTLFMATRLAASDALVVSIDLPGGQFGGGYPDWKIPIYESFARKDQNIELLRSDSHSDDTIERLKEILNGKSIDYLFIDGDHTYEGVKVDFERYKELVRPGGKIGFHDIAYHPDSSCDVFRYWNEIKEGYRYSEFIDDPSQGKFGVGVIQL